MIYRFEIRGVPRTKGNSRVVAVALGRMRFLPSKPYQQWFKWAMEQLPLIRVASGLRAPLRCPVRVTATFYRDRVVGDLDNYQKGLGDFLQRARLIENDRQIVNWDGRLEKDAARPRVEVEITTFEET